MAMVIIQKLINQLIKWLMNLTKFTKVPINGDSSNPLYGIIWQPTNRLLIYKPNDPKNPFDEMVSVLDGEEPTFNKMIFGGQYNGPDIGYKDLNTGKTIIMPILEFYDIVSDAPSTIQDTDIVDTTDLIQFLNSIGIGEGSTILVLRQGNSSSEFAYIPIIDVNNSDNNKGIYIEHYNNLGGDPRSEAK